MCATSPPPTARSEGTIHPLVYARLVRRLMAEAGCDSLEAEATVDATVCFLRLCAEHPGHRFTPSAAVDLGWHVFLLHTRDYREFCQANGGRFIDHEPTDRSDGVTPKSTVASTVEFMREHGIPFDEALWTAAGAEVSSCDSDDQSPCTHS